MSDYIPVLASLIAAASAVATAVIAWKLKTRTDERERSLSEAKQRRDERQRLYADVYIMFEQAINKVRRSEHFSLDKDLSDVNARVQLRAPERIIALYEEVAQLLTEWSVLFSKASPRRMTVGDQTLELVQAPDPTAPYKKPERDAYQKLQDRLRCLVQEMRSDLADSE